MTTQDFLPSDHVLALLTAIFIFLITIWLVLKNWVGFWTALILLVFAIFTGVVVFHRADLNAFLDYSEKKSKDEADLASFKVQIIQAVEDVKMEVAIEQENLRRVAVQVQNLFEEMENQKQKLQNFIEETREKFKPDQKAPNETDKNSKN